MHRDLLVVLGILEHVSILKWEDINHSDLLLHCNSNAGEVDSIWSP